LKKNDAKASGDSIVTITLRFRGQGSWFEPSLGRREYCEEKKTNGEDECMTNREEKSERDIERQKRQSRE
jgi:hypothetical protein